MEMESVYPGLLVDMRINKSTQLCISIASNPGDFGARFHNMAYKALDLNWVYKPFKVDSILKLERAINGVRALGIRGCSVQCHTKKK